MMVFKSAGLKLFRVGLFLIFMGVILITASSFVSDNNVSTGIIIIVDPFPIIIGAGLHTSFALFTAAVLTVLCLFLFFFMRRQQKQTG